MKQKKSKLQKSKDDPFSGYWLRRADKLFGRLWHSEERPCAVCRLPGEMAHLIPRENYLYRWDSRNVLGLCPDHHKFSWRLSYHGTPVHFAIWLEKHCPEQYRFVETNKQVITRKAELPWTFKEKAGELEKALQEKGLETN